MPAIHTSPMAKPESHKDFNLPDASAASSNGKVAYTDQDCSNVHKDGSLSLEKDTFDSPHEAQDDAPSEEPGTAAAQFTQGIALDGSAIQVEQNESVVAK